MTGTRPSPWADVPDVPAPNARPSRWVALLRIVAWPLGLVVLVVAWPLRLRARRARSAVSGWARLERRSNLSTSSRSTSIGRSRPPGPTNRTLVVLLVITLVAGAVVLRLRSDDSADDASGPAGRRGFDLVEEGPKVEPIADETLREPVDPGLQAFQPTEFTGAMADAEWFRQPETFRTIDWMWTTDSWLPVNPYRFGDLRSRHMNIENGTRRTWQPPAGGTRPIRIWIYGGSTTFGLNQRDDHTIPSELARVAAQRGITLEVMNGGQVGEMHWMEAERFAWDLTRQEPPDLVLFYDGFNDVWSAGGLQNRNARDYRGLFDPSVEQSWDALTDDPPTDDGPPGARFLGPPEGGPQTMREFARTLERRLDRSMTVSRASAAVHGIRTRYYWQPTRVSRPIVAGEPHGDAEEETQLRLREQIIREHLPTGVVDLSDVFDATKAPLFTDDIHHNEAGARIVAQAMFDDIEPDLAAIAAERGGS